MGKRVIILTGNDLKFDYSMVEIIKFRRLWKAEKQKGHDNIKIINILSKALALSADSVALLALDQIRKGKIK